jgi:hypothetical protein
VTLHRGERFRVEDAVPGSKHYGRGGGREGGRGGGRGQQQPEYEQKQRHGVWKRGEGEEFNEEDDWCAGSTHRETRSSVASSHHRGLFETCIDAQRDSLGAPSQGLQAALPLR